MKPSKTSDMSSRIMFQPGGAFKADNVTLKTLINLAYGLLDYQISGGPSWLDSDRYNVEAKVDPAADAERRNMTEEQMRAEMDRRKLMLQALLADRFKLAVHNELKELPVYALVIAKNGPKFKESAPDDKERFSQTRMGREALTAHRATTALLAEMLANALSRDVVDQTGLKGKYDFELKWAPEEEAVPTGPSIYTAIQEQLGLRLESQKSRVNVMVIDHAERASEN